MKKKKIETINSKNGLTIEYDIADFEKSLPNLYNELNNKKNPSKIKIDGIKHEKNEPQGPSAIEFIQRCKNIKEALEIIEFLKDHGEITENDAIFLQKKIENEGLETFGPKKTFGHYERDYKR